MIKYEVLNPTINITYINNPSYGQSDPETRENI